MKKIILLCLILSLCATFALPALAEDTGATEIRNRISCAELNPYKHVAAIDLDNNLWTWGANAEGQLGKGDTEDLWTPVKVMENVLSVATGFEYTLAIQSDNSLWAWGYNGWGNLGDGTKNNHNTPVKIMDDASAVCAASCDSFAITTDGSLWAWGCNEYATHGDGTTLSHSKPQKVMSDVIAVSSNGVYTLAVKADGSLLGWGYDSNGILGNENKFVYTPVKVMDGVASISLGMNYALILKADGTLWGLGCNESGQIGHGTDEYVESSSPTKIMDDVKTFSAAGTHSLAVKKDGTLWSWGANYNGEQGDGSFYPNNSRNLTPTKIMSDVDYAVSGRGCCFAIKRDGSVWSWGKNKDDGYYRLGYTEGNVETRDGLLQTTPRQIDGIPFRTESPSWWAFSEVNDAIDAGLVPEALQQNYQLSVSRGDVARMFINLIEKSSGKDISEIMDEKGLQPNVEAFTDTNDKAVLEANALGIINGVGNNKFEPNGTFTRAQIAAIINRIARVLGVETEGYVHGFTDVSGHWVDTELSWPSSVGIINGVGNNIFDPDAELTTEQAIVIAYRALQVLKKQIEA